MSPPPPPPAIRRDWTLPIIAGVVAIVVLLGLCVFGGATAYYALRRQDSRTASPAPTAAPVPTPAPSSRPPQPNAGSGPECLIGDWLEINVTQSAEIYGATVQLSGKGTIVRFAPDGTFVSVNDNVVLSGTEDGDTYEVIFNGSLKLNYVADAEKILYSSPTANGTTTWKINGKVKTSEPISTTLEPDTYKCQGNELRTFWDGGAAEFRRILPPGVPV